MKGGEMENKLMRKILSLVFIFNLIFQQTGLAQGIAQLDIAKYLNLGSSLLLMDKFRPLHLRYFSYNPLTDNFQILLDKGNLKDIPEEQLKDEGSQLLKYFLIGVTLPDEKFWVNLRPDKELEIIDSELAQTDMGRILLEADLQLKKDTALATSPQTSEGRAYWDKIYKKAEELFGTENITIPTLTRPWIVPGEVIIRETTDSAYVYKATLQVMLEQDHLKDSTVYNFKDPRLKELNEYSSQLIREKIIPQLTKEVNNSKKYASLRQVFYSLILSRWFKARFIGKSGLYPNLINKQNLNGLISKEPWVKTTYFKEYQKSFKDGEYNIKEPVYTPYGQSIRSYFSGGIDITRGNLNISRPGISSSPLGIFNGSSPIVTAALGKNMVSLAGTPTNRQVLPGLAPTMWAEGFLGPMGVKFAHDKVLKERTEMAFMETMFNNGQAIPIFGHNHLNAIKLKEAITRVAIALGLNTDNIPQDVFLAQQFIEKAFANDEFIKSIAWQIRRVDENAVKKALDKAEKDLESIKDKLVKNQAKAEDLKKVKEIHQKLKASLDFLMAVKETFEANNQINLKRAKELFVDQTRFVAFLFGEKGLDPSLFNIGDIASVTHRNLVTHAGRFLYPGSIEKDGGPRSIYLTLARILGFMNRGEAGLAAFRAMMIHEFEDFARGRHSFVNDLESDKNIPDQVAPMASEISRINSEIDAEYRTNVLKVKPYVEGRGIFSGAYDNGKNLIGGTDKVKIEKLVIGGGVVAIYGSSKTHPDVPKGSRKINASYSKVDVGSKGGHGTPEDTMLEAFADILAKAAEEGKILDFFITRCGDDISVVITHINGKDNPMIHKLIWDASINATVVAMDMGLYGAGQDILVDAFAKNLTASGFAIVESEFIERTAEVFVILQGDKWGPGGYNELVRWVYTDRNSVFPMLKPEQANRVKFGVIDFENDRRAILDPQKMNGLQFTQAINLIAGEQTRYSFTNLTLDGEDIAGITASRLHNFAGVYTGKDDPGAMFRTQYNYPAEGLFTAPFFGLYKLVGWMSGSEIGYALPVSIPDAKIGVNDGPPLVIAYGFNINNGRLLGFYDLFAANPAIKGVQDLVGKETAKLLSRTSFLTQGEGLGPAAELAYQKGPKAIDKIIPWEKFEADGKASSPITAESTGDIKLPISLTEDVQLTFEEGIRLLLGLLDEGETASLLNYDSVDPGSGMTIKKEYGQVLVLHTNIGEKESWQLFRKADNAGDFFFVKGDGTIYSVSVPSGLTDQFHQEGVERIRKNRKASAQELLSAAEPVLQNLKKIKKRINKAEANLNWIIEREKYHFYAGIYDYAMRYRGQIQIMIIDPQDVVKPKPTEKELLLGEAEVFIAAVSKLPNWFNSDKHKLELTEKKMWRIVDDVWKKPWFYDQKQNMWVEFGADLALDQNKNVSSSPVMTAKEIMQNRIIFGGNWKERKDLDTEEKARAKAREFRSIFAGAKGLEGAEIVIFPEEKWVKVIAEELADSNIAVGVQSLFFNPQGDLQGQIDRAVEMGARYANVAHSMHRAKGLTNEEANKIMKAILKDGRLIPWYTIEESGKEDAQKEIASAIDVGLAGISAEIIATFPTTLEPTVLISTKDGTGRVDPNLQPSKKDAVMRSQSVRETFRLKFGDTVADESNVGYGASVKSSNAQDIFSGRGVKNALIGGASLEAEEFLNTVINGMKGVASTSSSSPIKTLDGVGGIDFTAINFIAQPMGSFSGLKFSLPKLSNIERFNLDEELSQIQKLLKAGIVPSGERLKEYIAICLQKREPDRLNGLIGCLVELCKLEEEQVYKTSPELKEVLVLVDYNP